MHLLLCFLPIAVFLAWLIGVYQEIVKLINYINDSFERLLGIDLSTVFDFYYYVAIAIVFLSLFFAIRHSLKLGWSIFLTRFLGFAILGQLSFFFLMLAIFIPLYWGGVTLEKIHLIEFMYSKNSRGQASWVGFYSLFMSFACLLLLYFSVLVLSEFTQGLNNITNSKELDFSLSAYPPYLGRNEIWYGAIFSIVIISICCVVIEHHIGEYAYKFLNISATGLIILLSMVVVGFWLVVTAIKKSVNRELLWERMLCCFLIAIQKVAALLVGAVFVFLLGLIIVNVWLGLSHSVIYGGFFYFVFPLLFFWLNIYLIYMLVLGIFKYIKQCLFSLKRC